MNFDNAYDLVEIPFWGLIRNIGLGIILAVLWAGIIRRSTRLIVDTRQYLPMFLLLIPSMILIISVIKSSIALSLGLVGALSIVRFRTPIKEPEELLYIFVAIAIGLGLGANQPIVTVTGFVLIAACLTFYHRFQPGGSTSESYYIDLIIPSRDSQTVSVADVSSAFRQNDLDVKVKRVVDGSHQHEITLMAGSLDFEKYESVKRQLNEKYDGVTWSLVDNTRMIT